MGGYVACELVRLAPGRIEGLVLVATSARGDNAQQLKTKTLSVRLVDPERFHGLSRGAVTSSLHPDRASDEDMIERVRAMSERVGGEVFIRHASHTRESDLDRLAVIRCPTLVIAADGDGLRSVQESEELRDGIESAEFNVIEGSGHMIPIEAPEALLEIMLPWLQKMLRQ
jgi:pimeloyl-ACP methyl ester carboxylesterase